MQHRGGPRLLITDRAGAIYLERARIHVEGDRIVYHITDDEHHRVYNIPHVNLAVLFIGQGTSITQDAIRLLGEEKVHLAVTGSGGSPMHMGALTTYTSTRHFREMLPIYLERDQSLIAAKSLMRDRSGRMKRIGDSYAKRYLRVRDTSRLKNICGRFDSDLQKSTSIEKLLGFEGQFSKACYAEFSRLSGLSKEGNFRRKAGSSEPRNSKDNSKLVNRLIDCGNYLCYGMAGAALWALGIPPHMSVFHGKTRAGGLVFDLADSFKDSLVLPLAFGSILNRDEKPEAKFRLRMIDAFNDRKILKEAITSVNRMIAIEQMSDERRCNETVNA